MCPIICRWKLVKHRYCFVDNRRTKDNRKIKLCGLKACCVTLISCSISANFPALKRWNEKSEVVIAKIKTVPQKASIWEFKIDIFVSSEILLMNSDLHIGVSEAKYIQIAVVVNTKFPEVFLLLKA